MVKAFTTFIKFAVKKLIILATISSEVQCFYEQLSLTILYPNPMKYKSCIKCQKIRMYKLIISAARNRNAYLKKDKFRRAISPKKIQSCATKR